MEEEKMLEKKNLMRKKNMLLKKKNIKTCNIRKIKKNKRR